MTGRDNRGFGLMAALIVLGIAIVLAGVLTVQLASLTDRTARYSRGIRARALAEAGVEAALARVARERDGAFVIKGTLEGGTFDARVDAVGEKRTVCSTGRLDVGGSAVTCRITVELSSGPAGGEGLHVLSRSERNDYSRR